MNIHNPIRTGDFCELCKYVEDLYNNDDLRDDNYIEISKMLNEIIHKNRDNKNFCDNVAMLFKSVMNLDIDKKDDNCEGKK